MQTNLLRPQKRNWRKLHRGIELFRAECKWSVSLVAQALKSSGHCMEVTEMCRKQAGQTVNRSSPCFWFFSFITRAVGVVTHRRKQNWKTRLVYPCTHIQTHRRYTDKDIYKTQRLIHIQRCIYTHTHAHTHTPLGIYERPKDHIWGLGR